MDQATNNRIVIWGIADDVLRDLFKRGKYPGRSRGTVGPWRRDTPPSR